jgi:cyclopropane fatty-acyl-phospholipid synthase-like methyltransferase
LNLPEEAKILDLACGKGRHSIYLNQLGYDVTGADLSENSIKEASKSANEKFANLAKDKLDKKVNLKIDQETLNNLKSVVDYLKTMGTSAEQSFDKTASSTTKATKKLKQQYHGLQCLSLLSPLATQLIPTMQ